jgi:hypothetical protein
MSGDRLVGHPVILRLDPVSGEPTGRIDVEAEGCTFERLEAAPGGPIWLVDAGWPGIYDPVGQPIVEADRQCIGYFPADGSEPRIIELPGSQRRFWDVEQAAPLGDELWIAAVDRASPICPGARCVYDLYRVDPDDGSVELIQDRVSGVAAANGSLYVVDSRKKGRDAAGVLSADGTSIEPVDVPLRVPKRRDSLVLRVDGTDDTVTYLEPGHAVYRFLPTNGEATAMKAPSTGQARISRLPASADGLWIIEGTEGFGLSLKHAPYAATLEATDVADGPYQAVASVSPEAIWMVGSSEEAQTLPDGREAPLPALVRIDAATLEPTTLAGWPWNLDELPPPITPGS